MNRRQFLQRGFIGGVLLAGAGLFVYPSRSRDLSGFAPKHLSPRAFAILVAIAERIVPHVADARQVAARVDASLDFVSPDVPKDMEKLLLLFDNALAGLVFTGHVTPFSRLAPDAQVTVLESWRDSAITLRRSGYQALRRVCLGACYLDKEQQRAIGYPGPRRIPGLSFDDSQMGTRAWLAAQEPKK